NFLHLVGIVVIEPRGHTESRPKGRAYHPGACGRANQCELWQIKAQTSRLRPLVDDDVQPVILRRRVKIFLYRRLQPMDFVDEKHVAFFQAGQETGKFTSLLNNWSARVFDVHTHRVRDDVSQGRLAETGRRSEEHTSELQSRSDLVCRLLLEKKK